MFPMRSLLAALVVASPLAACTPEVRGGALLPALAVTQVTPAVLLPGTQLTIHGTGFTGTEVSQLLVLIQGRVDGEPVEFATAPARLDDETLTVPIAGQVRDALVRSGGHFVGTVTVLRTPTIDAPAEEAGLNVDLRVETTLTPVVSSVAPETLYVGDTVSVYGDGFLFPGEGASLVELRGTMTTSFPVRSIEVEGLQIPAIPAEDGRDRLVFTLSPDLFGIVPGRFDGSIQVINQPAEGEVRLSDPHGVSLPLAPPIIDGLEPLAASRGQWVHLHGRGLTAPDGLLQSATILVFEGTFTTTSGTAVDLTGPRALTIVPDLQVDNTLAGAVLRVQRDADGELTGLGVTPGHFSGTVSPLLLLGADQVRGTPLAASFDILPQKQVIYMRALPAFDNALATFGLFAEKEAVKQRILEVVTRDYAGISIAFTWEEPKDYAEFGVVEIADIDPNGNHVFGLDNTEGKDVGNLRFNDVIGGYNADTQAVGYSAYGGVFPGEFMAMSVRAGAGIMTNQRFDDIFEPVVPALGGRAAERGESEGSDQRAADIREAVRVFGNLTGNTISHEVGHSLGLPAIDGQFHHPGDNPGWIMDNGGSRPFEERAELDGQGPAVFGPIDQPYLERILPLDN